MGTTVGYLNTASFNTPDVIVQREPFPFLIARNTLDEQHKAELRKDFPMDSEAGLFSLYTK